MPTLSYTNPYASTTPCSQINILDVLENIERSDDKEKGLTSPRHVAVLTTSGSKSEWNLVAATRFVDIILPILTKNDLSAIVLVTLARILELWDDSLLYTVAVHHESEDIGGDGHLEKATLLETLKCLAVEITNPEKSHLIAALVPLMVVWGALDRLHRLVALIPDSAPFWLTNLMPRQIDALAQQCLEILTYPPDDSTQQQHPQTISHQLNSMVHGGVHSEDIRIAIILLLVHLLQYHENDWLFRLTSSKTEKLQHRLLQEATRLKDYDMPGSTYTKLSLASLELLVHVMASSCSGIMKEGVSQPQPQQQHGLFSLSSARALTTDLTEALIQALWLEDSSSTAGPRWTQRSSVAADNSLSSVSHQCLSTLLAMCRSSEAVHEMVKTSPIMRRYMERSWSLLLSGQQQQQGKQPPSIPSKRLYNMCMFQREFRSVLQQAFRDATARISPCEAKSSTTDQLSRALYACVGSNRSTEGAVLLRMLSEDRSEGLAHTDDFCLAFWESTKEVGATVENLLREVLQLAGSSSLNSHSLLQLSLLDACYCRLAHDKEACRRVVHSLTAQTVESLIYLVTPKESRMGMSTYHQRGMMEVESEPESNESTPPCHNLSRIEDRSVLIEQEQSPRGFDVSIRASCAATLALLSAISIEHAETHAILLQGRMQTAASDFASSIDQQLGSCNNNSNTDLIGMVSEEMTKRKWRLFSTLSKTAHQEDFVAGLVYASDQAKERSMMEYQNQVERQKCELKRLRQREKELTEECAATRRILEAQRQSAHNANETTKRRLKRQAEDAIAVHSTERSTADKKAAELAQKLEEMQKLLQKAQIEAQTHSQNERKFQLELDSAKESINLLKVQEQELQKFQQEAQSNLSRHIEDKKKLTSRLQEAEASREFLDQRVQEQADALGDYKETYVDMQSTLEEIFGDMVYLTRLYESKDQEVDEIRKKSDALERKYDEKVQAERMGLFDLKEQCKQLQYENEALSAKYARAREKLEAERQQRRKEDDRRRKLAPISYINQLHASSSERDKSSSRSQGLGGKENESAYSRNSSTSSKNTGRTKTRKPKSPYEFS